MSEIEEVRKDPEIIEDLDIESEPDFEDEEIPKDKSPTNISLRLGDIISILAPKNPDLNENTFFIEYIDSKYISLIDIATLHKYPLNISDGVFTDETIKELHILNRAEEDGYARQNNLLPGIWIELHISTAVLITITGEIVDLEEDQIKIITYPDMKEIYVNFDYKGIPKNIPFEKIVIREKPAELEKIGSLKDIKGLNKDEVDELQATEEDISIEYLDNGEAIITGITNKGSEKDFREKLHDLYRNSQDIVFLEDLEDIVQLVELPEHLQRYSVDVQVNSIIDEMLSTIPNPKRTKQVIDRIHLLVERYKELRLTFSKFDDNNNIRSFKMKDAIYKPLVERLHALDTRLKWILPVVESNNKIYDVEGGDDDETLNIGDVLESDTQTMNRVYYENKTGEENKYLSLYRSINDSVTPFSQLPDSPDYLTNTRVKINIEAIIQNAEDFFSITVHKANTMMSRFVIESYNLGLTQLVSGFATDENQNSTWRRCTEGGKQTNTRIEMTPADKIPIKSIIVLPKPVMQYSKIYLPSTNILDRTNLHQTNFYLFRLLRKSLKNTNLIQHIVDDLDKEIDYEALEKDSGVGFLAKTTEFILDESKTAEPNKFYKFLSTIFPKTRVLLRFIRNQLQDKLSVASIMDALEPFLIYSDDITYGHYANEIRYFIKTRISELRLLLLERAKPFKIYKDFKFKSNSETKVILRILQEKPELFDRFLLLYGIKDKTGGFRTSNEISTDINLLDQNQLFMTFVSTMLISLRIPDNISIIKNNTGRDDIEFMDNLDKIKPTDCSQKVITKLYESMEALMKDNHNDDVFYDKDHDSTPYNILKKYDDQQKKMSPDKFLAFLIENLVQKHECPIEMAPELAKIIIEGKKRIMPGEYAVVIIKPKSSDKSKSTSDSDEEDDDNDRYGSGSGEEKARRKTMYFQRKKNVWVQDKDADETMFVDSSVILCNMTKSCAIKQSRIGDVCDSVTDVKKRLMEDEKMKASKEFDRRYQISLDDLKSKLEKELTERIRFIQRLSILKDVQLKRTNYLEYEYGKGLQLEEITVSPYQSLLDIILNQDDFTKKQLDIIRFAAKFTRDPIIGLRKDSLITEDEYWKYCKETNIKLLPDFLVILAQDFCNGGDYDKKLEEISTPDRIDIVGNRVIDIHSGRTMRFLDFSTEEGYNDAGFRISTNAVLEKSNMDYLNILDNIRVFNDEITENIYNITSAICKNIDIPIKMVEENVLHITLNILNDNTIVASEEGYAKRAAKAEKKQTRALAPFIDYKNEMMIIITVSVLAACIQSIQGLKSNKTFPGCVRSFSGYPFGGIEDLSTIEYFACILEKMRNRSIQPWNSIFKVNRQELKDRIRTICEKAIVLNHDILLLFQKKSDYLKVYPEIEYIPESLQLKGWKQFLPPILKIDIIKHLQPISQTFRNDFLELLKTGNKSQTEDLLVLKSKIIQHTFGIIQSIQEVVDSKTVLLKTMSNVPFLQNACCNEKGISMQPIKYFINENQGIDAYIKSTSAIINTIDFVKRISKAGALFDPRRTGLRMVNSDKYQSDQETIYSAFIHYCRLDKTGFIPAEFHNFFPEIPSGYNKRASIAEKIVLLKQEGKNFNEVDLLSLMTTIRKKNIIEKYSVPRYSFVGILKDILENFDRTNSNVIEEPLRRHLEECINDYSPTRFRAIEPQNPQKVLEDLKDYLADTNERMYVEIVNFIREFAKNIKNEKMQNIMAFLSTKRVDCNDSARTFSLQSWRLDCDMEKTGKYYDNGLYTIFNFVKESIHSITHIFPEIILNNVNYTNIPEHWGFGKNDIIHMKTKVEGFLSTLAPFKEDIMITRFLQEIRLRNIDLYLFLSNLPIHTPIVKDGITYYSIFDKHAILQIINYVFYSVLHEYIMLTRNDDMLRIDRVENHKDRRSIIREGSDPEGGLFSQEYELDERQEESFSDLMEVQILTGERDDLKTRIANLIVTYIDIIQRNKTLVDYSYEEIAADVRSSQLKEKNMIIKRLQKLTIEERRVENMMKNYRLGKWNVGQQRGLVEYDIATQERERQDLIEQGVLDNEEIYNMAMFSLNNDVTADAADIHEIQREDDEQAAINDHNAMFDFGNLGENYDEGYDPDGYAEEGDFADT